MCASLQENLKKMEFLIRQKLYQDGGVMLNKNLSINLFSLNTCSVLDIANFYPSIYTHSIPGQFTQKKKMLKQQEEQVEILETKLIMPYDR
ncbi:hypothetical protein DMI69_24325 [Escherichia coli]|nr:hypothetical protein [Escherichia coli]